MHVKFMVVVSDIPNTLSRVLLALGKFSDFSF